MGFENAHELTDLGREDIRTNIQTDDEMDGRSLLYGRMQDEDGIDTYTLSRKDTHLSYLQPVCQTFFGPFGPFGSRFPIQKVLS